jgi:hypothetical protein
MSVPSSISQLSVTASQNSSAETEPIGNNLSLYLNAGFAFIAQLANGSGLTQAQALNMNSYQINNVAAGTASTDAINLGQLHAYLPIGNIQMWYGQATQAAVQAAWGTDWALCNGQNGTQNMMDKFPIGAGNLYANGATGGTTSYTLSTANLPVHNHPVSDPSHIHPFSDPWHSHSTNEAPHAHGQPNGGVGQAGTDNGGITAASGPNGYGSRGAQSTNAATTGISLNASPTGISIGYAQTGITVGNTGSGQAFTVIPPYCAVCFVQKISNS